MKNFINVVLVGDAGTGKTSIILSLVGEEFISDVPPKIDNITIPPDMSQDGISTNIIDTSLQEQDEIEIGDHVRQADVVCVVCDCTNMSSFYSLEEFWLDLIRDSSFDGPRKPVIIVCNKADLVEQDQIEYAVELMDKHFQIATCVMSSAVTLKNISEVFYYSQMSYLYPIPVLYDAEKFCLTELCREIFARIFHICDQNNDGILDDDEMYVFQKFCFDFSLEPTALMEVKSMLYDFSENFVRDGGITKEGFIKLQVVFIQQNQQETVWNVLRKFGYDEDLTLMDAMRIEILNVSNNSQIVEMSQHGVEFVLHLFDKHDSDNDGYLSFSDLNQFTLLDPSFFFNDTCYFDIIGRISRKLFLMMWRVMVHVEPISVLRAFVFLGFGFLYGPVDSAIKLIPRAGLFDGGRSVFYSKVFSTSYQSKIDLFSQFQVKYPALRLTNFGFDEIFASDSYKLMILEDCNPSNFTSDSLGSCDGACFLYDGTDPSSFDACSRVCKQILVDGSPIPSLVVIRSNGDRRQVMQDTPQQPRVFCSNNQLTLIDFPASSFKEFLQNLFKALSNSEPVENGKKINFWPLNVSNTTLTVSFSVVILVIGFFIGRSLNK